MQGIARHNACLLANMVKGVSTGFSRKMEIFGTGYNLKEQGGKLVFSLGFAHPVEMPIPKGIKVQIEVPATKGNEVPAKFTLIGADKQLLGQFAANLRKIRPPEPYKGKGVRYAERSGQKEGRQGIHFRCVILRNDTADRLEIYQEN